MIIEDTPPDFSGSDPAKMLNELYHVLAGELGTLATLEPMLAHLNEKGFALILENCSCAKCKFRTAFVQKVGPVLLEFIRQSIPLDKEFRAAALASTEREKVKQAALKRLEGELEQAGNLSRN